MRLLTLLNVALASNQIASFLHLDKFKSGRFIASNSNFLVSDQFPDNYFLPNNIFYEPFRIKEKFVLKYLNFFYKEKSGAKQLDFLEKINKNYNNFTPCNSTLIILNGIRKERNKFGIKQIFPLGNESISLSIGEIRAKSLCENFDYFKINLENFTKNPIVLRSFSCVNTLIISMLTNPNEPLSFYRHGSYCYLIGLLGSIFINYDVNIKDENDSQINEIDILDVKLKNCSAFPYFLQAICQLSTKLFKFDNDSTPMDFFTKFIILCQLNYKNLIKDRNVAKDNDKTGFSTSSKTDINDVTSVQNSTFSMATYNSSEYLNFVKIYRNQYRLIFIQFLFIQAQVDQKLATERFLIVCATLDTLHWLMTLICNSNEILNHGSNLTVLEPDLIKIENGSLRNKCNDKQKCILDGDYFIKNECIIHSKRSALYVFDKLAVSIVNLIKLPLEFYHNKRRVGILEWNVEQDKRIREIEIENK